MADDKEKSPLKVLLKNVRLSYPAIYKPKGFKNSTDEPRFSANFILDPETKLGRANIARMEAAIDYAIENTDWKGKTPKFAEAKLPLRDGDNIDSDGYEGMMFVSASNPRRPKVVDRDKLEVQDGDDDAPYAGCFVDAAVRVWAQNNEYGKRINCSLEAVRFRDDGESFGAGQFDVDDFDELDDDDEDDRPSRGRGRSKRDDAEDDRGSSRSSKRSRDEDEDEDDRPSRGRGRSKRDEDEDEDERPSRGRGRSKRDEDEDEDDRPSRGRGRSKRDEDEDEDERPSRGRSKRDEDDDDGREERRSRRPKRDEDEDEKPRARRSRRDDDDI